MSAIVLGPSSQCLDTDLVAYMEKYQVCNASISSNVLLSVLGASGIQQREKWSEQ